MTDLIYELHDRGDVADKYWAYMEAYAKALVDQYWPYIESVAKALLERGSITGDIRNVFPRRSG